MSIQPTITVVLANRPRLFRELLQHALNTESTRFRVVEATDAASNLRGGILRDANWLIVDEEAAAEATKLASAYPNLGVLALEGRGSRARLLAPAARASQQSISDVPTLAQLFELLSHEVAMSKQTEQSQ